MSGNLERAARAYIGPNKAHRQFVQKVTNEKIFVYLIMQNMDKLVSMFHKDIEETRRLGSKDFALGIVTKGISTTQFKGINIRANESALIAKDSQEFQSQVYGKAFAEVHRIFIDYTIDLLNEVLNRLPNPKKYDDLSYKKLRDKAFDYIGLSIFPTVPISGSTPDQLKDRLNELETTRHVIEHSNSIVDAIFLRRNPTTTYRVGQRINIQPEQIGEAIALVETLAEDLNERALKKFNYR